MKRLFFEYIPAWLLLMVFGFIVIHAPITVFISSHWPDAALYVKAWKEVFMLLAGVLIFADYTVSHKWRTVTGDKLLWLAAAFGLLHLILLPFSHGTTNTVIAGLMIDLRYVAYFAVVYMYLRRYPNYVPAFLRIGLVGAVIVVGFALLQVFLPHDFLKYLGYGDKTIEPFLTVDRNTQFIRENSTLRGPNPLGAYAIMVLAGAVGFWYAMRKSVLDARTRYLHIGLSIAGLVALWVSYSRGALLGAIVAVAIVLIVSLRRHITKKHLLHVLLATIVVIVIVVLTRNTSFVQNVILHNNPTTGSAVDSNEGHIVSLQQGVARTIREPLGAGIGSTGSASFLGNDPVVIENQYLFVAHESGWLGLALFLGLAGAVLRRLWSRRGEWQALATFASGVGLLVVGLFLPVWVDDTVSIVWWGLIAVILAEKGVRHARTSNKKAKRTT